MKSKLSSLGFLVLFLSLGTAAHARTDEKIDGTAKPKTAKALNNQKEAPLAQVQTGGGKLTGDQLKAMEPIGKNLKDVQTKLENDKKEEEKRLAAAKKAAEARRAALEQMKQLVTVPQQAKVAGKETDYTQGSISSQTFADSPDIEDLPGSNVKRPLVMDESCSQESGMQVDGSEEAIQSYIRTLQGKPCTRNETDRLTCMVCNIYFEARGEEMRGQIAAGQTVMTRLFSSTYSTSSDTVCSTVYKPWQYSWTMDSVLPQKDRVIGNQNIEKVVRSAVLALCKGSSEYTNYYAHKKVYPDWAKVEPCHGTLAKEGNHNFCTIGKLNDRSIQNVYQAQFGTSNPYIAPSEATSEMGE